MIEVLYFCFLSSAREFVSYRFLIHLGLS
jgi:N-carbamoylputrescine amidase